MTLYIDCILIVIDIIFLLVSGIRHDLQSMNTWFIVLTVHILTAKIDMK